MRLARMICQGGLDSYGEETCGDDYGHGNGKGAVPGEGTDPQGEHLVRLAPHRLVVRVVAGGHLRPGRVRCLGYLRHVVLPFSGERVSRTPPPKERIG